jgi:hypothetical protein
VWPACQNLHTLFEGPRKAGQRKIEVHSGSVWHPHLSLSAASITFSATQFHRLVLAEPHVKWLDNFSKTHAVGGVNLEKGSYLSCLWTGEAVNKLDTKANLKLSPDNPAMPESLFSVENVNCLVQTMKDIDKLNHMHASSMSVMMDVRNNPLKPALSKVQKRRCKKGLQQRGLDRFHPVSMSDHNIGSSVGLFHIIEEQWTNNWRDQTDMQFLSVDVNIYHRLLKVIILNSFKCIPQCATQNR